jgi:sialic acid synthase SpsE
MIIAELGHNFNGNIKLAKKMISKAYECGADIAKFQIYDVDYILTPESPYYWELKAVQINYPQARQLFKECKNVGIEFMASVFDTKRVKWTEKLGMERYKIASRSIKDKKLIKAIEDTGKPIIASLGMWDEVYFPDIKGKVDYLYCVSKYPTKDKDLHIPLNFNKYSGFSDHTIGTKWSKIAIDRGAKIIEKHFTLDKTMSGCDQSGSVESEELEEIVDYFKENHK